MKSATKSTKSTRKPAAKKGASRAKQPIEVKGAAAKSAAAIASWAKRGIAKARSTKDKWVVKVNGKPAFDEPVSIPHAFKELDYLPDSKMHTFRLSTKAQGRGTFDDKHGHKVTFSRASAA